MVKIRWKNIPGRKNNRRKRPYDLKKSGVGGRIHCRTEHRASGVESKRSGGISVSTGGRMNHDTAKAKGFLHTDKMCQVLPGLVQYATYTAMHSKLEAQCVARCC